MLFSGYRSLCAPMLVAVAGTVSCVDLIQINNRSASSTNVKTSTTSTTSTSTKSDTTKTDTSASTTPLPIEITISPASLYLSPSSTYTIDLIGRFADGSVVSGQSGGTFVSADTGIATVDTSGVVTGIANGTSSISVSYAKPAASATIPTTVGSSGTIVSSIGTGGQFSMPTTGVSQASALLVDDQERILVGGQIVVSGQGHNFYLNRLLPNGQQDTSFTPLVVDFFGSDDLLAVSQNELQLQRLLQDLRSLGGYEPCFHSGNIDSIGLLPSQAPQSNSQRRESLGLDLGP